MEVWSPAKLIGWKQIWFGPFEWSDENNFLRIVIYKCGQIWKTCIIANNIVTFNHPCSLRTVKGLEFLQSFLFDKETPQRFHLDLFSDTISIYNLTPTHWTENPGYLKSHPIQPKEKNAVLEFKNFMDSNSKGRRNVSYILRSICIIVQSLYIEASVTLTAILHGGLNRKTKGSFSDWASLPTHTYSSCNKVSTQNNISGFAEMQGRKFCQTWKLTNDPKTLQFKSEF